MHLCVSRHGYQAQKDSTCLRLAGRLPMLRFESSSSGVTALKYGTKSGFLNTSCNMSSHSVSASQRHTLLPTTEQGAQSRLCPQCMRAWAGPMPGDVHLDRPRRRWQTCAPCAHATPACAGIAGASAWPAAPPSTTPPSAGLPQPACQTWPAPSPPACVRHPYLERLSRGQMWQCRQLSTISTGIPAPAPGEAP